MVNLAAGFEAVNGLVKILVVYSSHTGNTKRLAELIAQGAGEEPGTEVVVKPASETSLGDLGECDVLIAGSPVYFGTMAADLKALFDKSVQVRGQLADKIGAAFATSGHPCGGKETTILSILEAMLIHQMIVIGDPLESGGHYGIGILGTEVAEQRDVALAFGRRVAAVARKLK